MTVPPMHFTVNLDEWEVPANRLPSRHISVDITCGVKQNDRRLIRPASNTAFTYVNQRMGGGLR